MENEILLVMSPSNEYCIFCALTLKSILDSSTKDDYFIVYILFDSLSDSNKQLIKQVECFRMKISFIDVSNYVNDNIMREKGYVKKNTYFRIIAPGLVKNRNKIIYIDSDMIVNHNLAELYNIELGECVIGAVKNWSTYSELQYVTDNLKVSNDTYFNAGILLINVQRYNDLAIERKAFTLLSNEEFKYFDQDVLNIVAKDYVKIINSKWNVVWHPITNLNIFENFDDEMKYKWSCCSQDPFIIHYTSSIKPWNSYGLPLSEYFWDTAKNSLFFKDLIGIFFDSMEEVLINSNCLKIIPIQFGQGKYRFLEVIKCIALCFKVWIKNKVKR